MSGTDLKNKPLIAEGPAVILVEPQLGENIGMVARAMANFGLAELRLVRPRDGWPNRYADKAASGAMHVIKAVSVHDGLEDAIGDLNFVLATTARPRDMIKTVRGPGEAAADLRRRFVAGEKTGLLYGRERWGLNNDEIALADEIVTFPVNPAFASLNIAQAVLLMGYEWLKTGDGGVEPGQGDEQPTALRTSLIGLADHLEEALDDAGYFRPPERRDKLAMILRNIITHMKLKEQEVRTLRGVVAALQGRKQGKV